MQEMKHQEPNLGQNSHVSMVKGLEEGAGVVGQANGRDHNLRRKGGKKIMRMASCE